MLRDSEVLCKIPLSHGGTLRKNIVRRSHLAYESHASGTAQFQEAMLHLLTDIGSVLRKKAMPKSAHTNTAELIPRRQSWEV